MVTNLNGKTVTLRLLSVAILGFVSFTGCKKDKNDKPEHSVPVALKSVYKSYEVAEIRYRNDLDASQPLAGTVGAKDVRIAVIDDSTLGIVVTPDIFNEGGNSLEFMDDNSTLSVSIVHEVNAPVTNPQHAFTEYKADVQQQIDFFQSLKANDTSGIFDAPDMKAAIDDATAAMAEMDAAWTALSETDKRLAANILAANAPAFKEIVTRLNDLASSIYNSRNGLLKTTEQEFCPQADYPGKWNRYKCFGEHFGNEIVNLTKNTGLMVGAAANLFIGAGSTDFLKLVFGKAKAAAVNIFYIGKEVFTWRAKVVKARFFTEEGSASKTTAVVTLSKDKENGMPVTITARRIQSTDVSTGPGWVSLVVSATNSFNSICDKFSPFLSKFRIKLNEPSSAEEGISSLSDISVNNISNSKVQYVGVGGTAAAPTIKFTTQESSDQNFSFDMTYNDGVNNPIVVKIDAKLTADDRVAILTAGTWRWITVWETWIEDGNQMSGEFLEGCEMDDYFKFNLGGSGIHNKGLELCDSTLPATQNFSWSFANDQNTLNFIGASFNVLSMTNSEFKVQRVYDDGGGLMVTQTATFVR